MDSRQAPTRPGETSKGLRRLLYFALVVLVALHQDFWGWYDASFVLGLPSGLTYHLFYCLAAAGMMALLVRFAWPHHLDDDTAGEPGEGAGR